MMLKNIYLDDSGHYTYVTKLYCLSKKTEVTW
jgi:hypothetical protein